MFLALPAPISVHEQSLDNLKVVIKMADTAGLEQHKDASFAPYFGLYHGLFNLDYEHASPDTKRMIAVACALELIKTQVANGNSAYTHVGYHMDHLSSYADSIEDALAGTDKLPSYTDRLEAALLVVTK